MSDSSQSGSNRVVPAEPTVPNESNLKLEKNKKMFGKKNKNLSCQYFLVFGFFIAW